MSIVVREEDFDIGEELATLNRGRTDIGATATFVGYVRNVNDGQGVSAMTLEHYPGMTQKALESIEGQARQRWDLIDVRIIHRVGRLLPGDQIVLVVVASAHRGEAFAACEFIMDFLKTQAPFWKKEETPQGAQWVDARKADDAAAARWNAV